MIKKVIHWSIIAETTLLEGKDNRNSLPDKVVKAPSIQSFQRRLDKHWRDRDLIFNYEAALRLGHKASYEVTALNFCSKSDEATHCDTGLLQYLDLPKRLSK